MPIVTVEGLRDQPTPSTTLPEVSWAIAAGTADLITASYDPAILALTDGLIVGFRATAANATTTPTFNANSLGSRTIVKDGGSALVPGDIPGPLAEMLVRYNLANTRWELLNPRGSTATTETEDPLPYIGVQTAPNLHLKNSTTDATNDMETTKGRVRDDSDTNNLRLAASIFKQLDVAWAAGGASAAAPAGACDASTKGNNQSWTAFLIGKIGVVPLQASRTSNVATLNFGVAHGLGVGTTIMVNNIGSGFDTTFLGSAISAVTATTISYASTGADLAAFTPTGTPTVDAFDMLYSQSATAPTMPTGWTKKQALGSVLSNGSAVIRPFFQVNDEFRLVTPVLSLNNVSQTTTSALRAISVPLGIQVVAEANVQANFGSPNSEGSLYISSPNTTDQDPSVSAAPLSTIGGAIAINTGSVTTHNRVNHIRELTDTSGQWRFDVTQTMALYLAVTGWSDPRRRHF